MLRPNKRWLQFSLRSFLIVCGIAGIVLWWFLATPRPLTEENVSRLEELESLDRDAYQLAWSHDGRQMACVCLDGNVVFYNASTMKVMDDLQVPEQLFGFRFGSGGKYYAYAGNSNTIKIVERRTGKIREIDMGVWQASCVFSPDETLIAVGAYGTPMKLFRVDDLSLVHACDCGPTDGGLTPVFSHDGQLLAVGNRNSTTCIFDVATGKLLHRLPKSTSQGLRFSPDDSRLAITYCDGSVTIWDVATGTIVHDRPTPAVELYRVDWSHDGSLLVTAGREADITVWRADTMTIIRELDAPEWIIDTRFTPDGSRLIVAGGHGDYGRDGKFLKVFGVAK